VSSTRRVLMTADAVGGVWTYALELAQALAAHDITVLLAVMGPAPSKAQRAAATQLENVQLEHMPFALEWMDSPWADVRSAGDWLLSLESKWRPDLCHLNGYCHAACAFAAPALVVAHSCVCSWWQAVHGVPADRSWTKYRHRVRAGLAAADTVVAPTRWMLEELLSHYGPLPRTAVIPNASNPGLFLHSERKEPFVFAAGRVWDDAKNLRVLDSAARGLPWPVMIAGATEGVPPETYAQSQLLGELAPSAIADWLARASIYALPARYEPFGLSVLEAGLCGCALVLGDIPSLRETWDGAARFVDPSDPSQLHAVLMDLTEDAATRRDLALRARERALRHSPTKQAAAYAALYSSVSRRTTCTL
jgi:glycogen(starch) synthase